MTPTRVLYDGWTLVRQPNHPAALHLLALLENLPADVQANLALLRNNASIAAQIASALSAPSSVVI